MAAQDYRFTRILLILMIVLYVISVAAFSYANWLSDPDPMLWMIVVNVIILSLPLILFYGSIYVLICAWREHRLVGQLDTRLAKIVHWAPRLAAILIILFVSLFSLDVFEVEATPLELLGALLLHNLPSFFLIVLLVFAWRWPAVGFIAFLIAGLFFLRFVFDGLNLGHFLLFSGPLLLVSALFYADWRWHTPQPSAPLDAAV